MLKHLVPALVICSVFSANATENYLPPPIYIIQEPAPLSYEQRAAIAKELAKAQLHAKGVDVSLIEMDPYSRLQQKSDMFNDNTRTANALAELAKNQQQLAQAYEQSKALDLLMKQTEAIKEAGKATKTPSDIVYLAIGFSADYGMSPYEALKVARVGMRYASRNSTSKGAFSDDEIRYVGIAIIESAEYLNLDDETVTEMAGTKTYNGNEHTDLLRVLGRLAIWRHLDSTEDFFSVWSSVKRFFGRDSNTAAFAKNEIVDAYIKALGKDFNSVRAARTMRAASDPAVVTPYLKQWGDAYGIQNPTWEMYRDAMNNSKNSSQLWTQYLLEVDKYINQFNTPKQQK